MNISAKLKSSQQPNYIFNFNIDIPLKYKSSITQRSNPTSPSKSPGKLNQKKYKLSSITPRPAGVSVHVVNPKKNQKSVINQKSMIIQKTNSKSNKKNTKIPKTMKQQFLQKDMYELSNLNFYQGQKKQSPSISRKTQKMVSNKKSLHQQQICPSRRTVKNSHPNNTSQTLSKKNVVRNISILQKLVTDDNIIKYTTDSSQIKKTQPSYTLPLNNFMFKYANKQKLSEQCSRQERIGTVNEDFDLSEIRQYEEISTQRKERINFQYLKQKILMQSSVKKIQRAWRRYITKKLVTSYSATIASKFVKNQLITSARSQARTLNVFKAKKPFKSNDLYMQKQRQNRAFDLKQVYYDEQYSSSDSSQAEDKPSHIKHEQFNPFSKKFKPSSGKAQKSFFENQKIKKIVQQQKTQSGRQRQAKNSSKKRQDEEQTLIQQKMRKMEISQKKRESQMQQKLKKFQEQQIRKWESILESIKKGKNIEVLLEKSQRYKKQLENNLKQIHLERINKNRASPILFHSNSIKSNLSSLSDRTQKSRISELQSIKQSQYKAFFQQKKQVDLKGLKFQEELKRRNDQNSSQTKGNVKTEEQDENLTAEKRKEKIIFFENQILKIDNEDYSDISSVSCQSFNHYYESKNVLHKPVDNLEQRQREENLKLRKKLQLFNSHFLDISSADEGLTDRSLKGLKGNSTDQRRSNINKRLNLPHNQIFSEDQQKIESQQPPSSEQSRKYRRPDVQISENDIGKQKTLSKIEQLINKKIEYPSEDSQSQESSLGAQNRVYRSKQNDLGDSDFNSNQVNFKGHQKHFERQHLYKEPVLTHRDRRLQVPELKLHNIQKRVEQTDNLQDIDEYVSNLKRTQQQQPVKQQNKQSSKLQKNRTEQLLESFGLLKNQKTEQIIDSSKVVQVQVKQILRICSYLQEQLIYQSLLEFSDSDRIVQNIKGLFDTYKQQEKKKIKPEGICTNLESIKDYLENFVGFIFQNKTTQQIETTLWTPSGPKVQDLLRYLRKDIQYDNQENQYIMNIDFFEKHWKYANSNIYFDKKYSDDKTEQERVAYLKGLTRVYFRSIFDAFNESLQFQRSFGLTGQPYPWCRKIVQENKKTLKTAFQQAYRRILKISVVYFGVHFDDKTHLFNEESIKQLQQQRLLTLLIMELQEDEYRWSFIEDEMAELKYDVGLLIEQQILEEFLVQFKELKAKQLQ